MGVLTKTERELEQRDIDFSMLPAVGESSLEHATRHIPIRTARKGVGFGGFKNLTTGVFLQCRDFVYVLNYK